MTSPLCFGQLSIWRSIETNPLVDGVRSQLTELRPLPAGVTEARVRVAVETLWRRHESLRTTFENGGGDVRQVVHAGADGVLESRFLGSAEEVVPSAEELFAQPFVLTREFGWRVRLLSVADGTAAVAFSVHHVLADEWALRLLLAEFHRLLTDQEAEGVRARQASGPAVLARQQHADGWAARRSAARVYWTRLTEDFADRTGQRTETPGERRRGSIDLSDVSNIVDQHRVTAHTVVLALFAIGIRASTGRGRIMVHLMVANRLRPDWQGLVASMNQIVPAGIELDERNTFHDLVRYVEVAGRAALRNGCYDVDEAAVITQRPPGSAVDYVLNYQLPVWRRQSISDSQPAVGDRSPAITPSTQPAIAGIYGVVPNATRPTLDLHVDSNRYPDQRLLNFLRGTEEALRLLTTHPNPRVANLIALY
ncbi:condensation domain-containing protein [Actinophytocola sediminis]